MENEFEGGEQGLDRYRNRYRRLMDGRRSESKAISRIIRAFRDELAPLNAGQELLLGRIAERLLILKRLGIWLDLHGDIVSEKGYVPAFMERTWPVIAEGLRRDVLSLYDLGKRKPSGTIILDQYLKFKAGGKGTK